MKIQVFAQDEVSLFAASELESYLSRMGRPALDFQLRVQNPACEDMPPVADAALDFAVTPRTSVSHFDLMPEQAPESSEEA